MALKTSIADIIADRMIEHALNLARFEAGQVKAILRSMQILRGEIGQQLQAADLEGIGADTARVSRLNALFGAIDATIASHYSGIIDDQSSWMSEIRNIEEVWIAGTVNGAIGVDVMTPVLKSGVAKAALNAQVVYGVPLEDWWTGQAQVLQRNYQQQVRIGMMANETTSEIVQRVRGKFVGQYTFDADGKKVRVFQGGVMDTSTRQAEALVRTSVASVSGAANEATMQRNEDVLNGQQALATLDNRTTPLCRARSGWAWRMDGSPIKSTGANIRFPGPPPWHVCCRTRMIPLVKSFADLTGPDSKLSKAKIRELEAKYLGKSTQASMDGQVAESLNYEQWLKTKPESFQREVLGEGRYNLWQRGKLPLRDMVDQSGNTLTLDELKAKYG